jgi:hypothetical protein
MDNIKKKTIHELVKANPNKTYKELEQEIAEQSTYENNGELVIDSTDDCENCQ